MLHERRSAREALRRAAALAARGTGVPATPFSTQGQVDRLAAAFAARGGPAVAQRLTTDGGLRYFTAERSEADGYHVAAD